MALFCCFLNSYSTKTQGSLQKNMAPPTWRGRPALASRGLAPVKAGVDSDFTEMSLRGAERGHLRIFPLEPRMARIPQCGPRPQPEGVRENNPVSSFPSPCSPCPPWFKTSSFFIYHGDHRGHGEKRSPSAPRGRDRNWSKRTRFERVVVCEKRGRLSTDHVLARSAAKPAPAQAGAAISICENRR